MPRSTLLQAMQDIRARNGQSVDWPVGIAETAMGSEIIVSPERTPWTGARTLRIALTDDLATPRWLANDPLAVLLIGRSRHRGHLRGYYREADCYIPMDSLFLVGPGLHVLPLRGQTLPVAANRQTQRWSRTKGALGRTVWARLKGLSFSLIGAGRTGSIFAASLIQLGIRNLTVIDPDTLEDGNLGEGATFLTPAYIGRPKAVVVSEVLTRDCPDARIEAISDSITHPTAISAAKKADVLISCTDHDTSRWVSTCLATMFCRPLLDIGTGISRRQPTRMGISARLVLPGQCLACLGGLDVEQVWAILSSATRERSFRAGRRWNRERLGSLASLNYLAASLGQRLLEDLVAERIHESTWLQGEFDQQGHLHVSYPRRAASGTDPSCPVCGRLAGRGDVGLDALTTVVREVSGRPIGYPPEHTVRSTLLDSHRDNPGIAPL